MAKPTRLAPPAPSSQSTNARSSSSKKANKAPAAGPALTAFQVFKVEEGAELLVGILGTGPGPFISADRKRPSHARYAHAQFNSSHSLYERDVKPLLAGTSLHAVARALEEKGFVLREVAYLKYFDPPSATPEPSAEDSAQVRSDVRDLTTP